ncbi:MAG: hypothetical protein WCL04_03255 [Verrucomicrobiota bacterium]
MKTSLLAPCSLFLLAGTAVLAPAATTTTPAELPVTVTVTVAPGTTAAAPATPSYDQQLYSPATSTIVSPEKAKQVVESFRAAYDKLGKPSLLLYVNRELVDTSSGLRITTRKEHVEGVQVETKSAFESDPAAPKPATTPAASPQTQITVVTGGVNRPAAIGEAATTPGKSSATTTTTRVTADNTYTATPKPAAALADRQTVRDIERLFGRPLRAGGGRLADHSAATELMADKPMDHFTVATDEAARKDREALGRIADVVIEVLISSRNLTVPAISGDQTVAVPDITATAIRLKDSAIIGQASASDVLGKKGQAARLARQFDVNDIAEATALALMEDMTLTGGGN